VQYKETLNTLQQWSHRVHPNWNTKDVLLLQDNAWPDTSLCAPEAITKIRWTVLPHPAHSPVLACSNYQLFGPVKDGLHRCHFADDNRLKQSLRDVLWSRGREFYNTGIQHLTQCWQALKMTDTLWKNSHITAKDVWIIHLNCIVIAVRH
jgi:hypothetical protein